jgi:hypothetical protein
VPAVPAREAVAGEVLPRVWGAAPPPVRPMRHGAAPGRQVLSGVRATGRLGRRRSGSLHVARVLQSYTPGHLTPTQVTLPASARSVTVPSEFVDSLRSGQQAFEVLAIEASGNQTITEGSFTKQ